MIVGALPHSVAAGAAGPAVRVRHLIHHTSGLPESVDVAGPDRTSAGVLGALGPPDRPPGTEFRYCNAGYVLLGTVVERAAGQSLTDFAPLGMTGTRYWAGPAAHPPGAVPTSPGHPAALSLGDGGVWSTASDLLRWNHALDRDELGISELVQTPGRLDDGTLLNYAWGMGVRTYAGVRVYRHGGSWAGVNLQLVRVPDRHAGFVIAAFDNDEQRTAALATTLIEELTTG